MKMRKVYQCPVYLVSMNSSKVVVDFQILIKMVDNKVIGSPVKSGNVFFAKNDMIGISIPRSRFFRREAIFRREDVLKNGTLCLEVYIKVDPQYRLAEVKSQPTYDNENMLQVFLNNDHADVAFKVGREIFPAHRVILKCQAPDLAELCETFDTTNPMPVDDVEPDIFRFMLSIVYGKKVDKDEWKTRASNLQSILRAAGKYGFSSLKSVAEAWYMKILKLEVDNVIDELLYADANNLLVVKRAVMDFITDNAEEVIATESFQLLSESPQLMKEVMKSMANHISTLKKRKRDN